MSRDRRHRQDTITRLQEQTSRLFEATREEVLGDPEATDAEQAERAWAAWYAALAADQRDFDVQSFAYLALELAVCQIVTMDGEV